MEEIFNSIDIDWRRCAVNLIRQSIEKYQLNVCDFDAILKDYKVPPVKKRNTGVIMNFENIRVETWDAAKDGSCLFQ